METTTSSNASKPALVFGASGEQGRAVIEGFVDAGYSPVYGFTSNSDTIADQYLSDALQCVILEGVLGNPSDVKKALTSTKAQTIFLTTTTEMPIEVGGAYQAAQDEEYDTIVQFFTTLKQV
jgi:NAD(P)-dependent dehydrogenase (short-subunit alcohol dehydrogenase family)